MVMRQRLEERGFDGGITHCQGLSQPRAPKRHAPRRPSSASNPHRACNVRSTGATSAPWPTAIPRANSTAWRWSNVTAACCISNLPTRNAKRRSTARLLGAFRFFQGTPKELVHDNMLTAVIAHQGPVVRFNEQFLEFLRPFHITPIACNVRQPQEKGKVEKGAIHSIRHNFWPLRSFTNLDDCASPSQSLARPGGQPTRASAPPACGPSSAFAPKPCGPCPSSCPIAATPPWPRCIAISPSNSMATPTRRRPGPLPKPSPSKPTTTTSRSTSRTEPSPPIRAAGGANSAWNCPSTARRLTHHHQRHWLSPEVAAFVALGEVAKAYLEHLATTQQPLQKSVKKLLDLKDDYGTARPLRSP